VIEFQPLPLIPLGFKQAFPRMLACQVGLVRVGEHSRSYQTTFVAILTLQLDASWRAIRGVQK